MSTGNVNLDILLNKILKDAMNDISDSFKQIRERYPKLSETEAREIFSLIVGASTSSEAEKVSLVITAPPSFSFKSKSTKNTVENMIKGARSSILITGYSLSEYFSELIDTIIEKSQKGVFVKFFVNNIEKQTSFGKLCRYKGNFLKIYNYSKSNDSMSALHAKVVSVDQCKTLITSANLSYHGQEGNIELGTLVESKDVAKQIDSVFTHLIFSKNFIEQ